MMASIRGTTRGTTRIAAAMLCLTFSAAPQSGDASRISRLLSDADSQTALVKSDLSTLDFIASSATPAQSYAAVVGTYRQHIATLRSQAAMLETARKDASVREQTTIDRVVPLLLEFAESATAALDAGDKNPGGLSGNDFKQYIKLNADLAGELSTLVSTWISYGRTREELARAAQKIGVAAAR